MFLKGRHLTQEERMLKLLRSRGSKGVENHKFHDIRILSHSKIISNLRKDGHTILKEPKYLSNGKFSGVYVYTLIEY